jgi:peptidoglycan/xylan/chitin deacetylase (PgdA/CDA1 family)
MVKWFVNFLLLVSISNVGAQSWIRINQMGYLPNSIKVAVLLSTMESAPETFQLCDAKSGKIVYSAPSRKYSGAKWGMKSAARLDFSAITIPGTYYLEAKGCRSPQFTIAADVYKGSADFVLRYMRQQRCGFNPYLNDSCHVHDGFIVDHPTETGRIIDVKGGWHDASDYLQYLTTSANALYQMMFAYQRNPEVYGDGFDASGRPGANGIPDVVDEIRWGLNWLLKMNPEKGVMYNQIADDRDHRGFRIPTEDTVSYGNGLYRPVYFLTGKPQGLAAHKNRTTGVSSSAGKFSSCFALAAQLFKNDADFSQMLSQKALEAFEFALSDLGETQTACNVSPYFYEESNYVDDLQLAACELYNLSGSDKYLKEAMYWGSLEPITPWMERGTARHYQYYPFVNLGHAHLAFHDMGDASFSGKMGDGLKAIFERGKDDPFLNGVPFIWCSNNLVTAAITQARLYHQATHSNEYLEMEAALRDWLFGCNPWGTSMICGLPEGGDYPLFPHSAITLHLGETTFGGLIDGPVYRSIYEGLRGIHLMREDEYALFQNGIAVYHDDIGDYSSNEPTMDGTASLSFYLSALEKEGIGQMHSSIAGIYDAHGALVRKDVTKKEIYLIFSADTRGEGMLHILNELNRHRVSASFFLTGNYLRDKNNKKLIKRIIAQKHYVGPHSDAHLLYAPWSHRDSLLVTEQAFKDDLQQNISELAKQGIEKRSVKYFLAPYEWYNRSISKWTKELNLHLINFTPGTGTNADYTTPEMPNYKSSHQLAEGIMNFETTSVNGLNGAILLIHPGTEPARTDKFYQQLGSIIEAFKKKGYTFKRF